MTYKQNILILICVFIFSSIFCIEGNPDNNIEQDKKTGSIIFIGDTQKTSMLEFWRERNDSISLLLLKKIASEEPACLVHLGDMVFKGSSSSAWQKFDSDLKSIKERNIQVYPILGNHEYFGNNKAAFRQRNLRFPFLKEKTWYSRKIKNAGIIFLNSNFNELSKIQNQEQVKWFESELKKFQNDSTISFIITAVHHPPYTNSKVVKDNKDVQELFVKPFMSIPKAVLFFSGHCHSYEHFIRVGKHFIVSGGGGGPRQELIMDPAKKRHDDVFNGPSLRDFNYCKLSFTEKGLLVEVIMLNRERKFNIGESFIIGYTIK